LDLAKAMLRHGYYAPDHPEAEQSLDGLYQDFRLAIGDDPGLTYLVGRSGDDEAVMVQAQGEGPRTLDQIMIRGMAELFAPKFLDFFHRRHLVSFSLRSDITAEEMRDFVMLMSEPPKAGGAEAERGRVEQVFLDKHIMNVSTVFESDIVGRKRKLPWRVEMALSRLGRDLRMLPLFERASTEEVQRVKLQILDDLVRPLRAPELVKDFLLNCDLIAHDMEVLEGARIEQEIIAQVPPDRLLATCGVIVDEMVAVPGDALADRRRLVLRHVLIGLLQKDVDMEGEILEACVSLGAATFEELPKEVRTRLKRRRAVDTFLVRKDEYLEALHHVPAGEKGVQLAKTGQVFFIELVNRECYIEAVEVLDALTSGNHEGEGAPAVREALDRSRAAVSEDKILDAVLRALAGDGERPIAEALIRLAAFAGQPAADPLRALYRESESRSVRAHVFDAIKGIGPVALIPFLQELTEVEAEWSGVHHVLVALAGAEDPSLAEPTRLFLRHENAHVRQAALARIFEFDGAASENVFIEALGDDDAAVRHAAVAHLGSLGSRHPKAMAYFTAALSPDSGEADGETSDEVLVEVCRTLASLAEASPDDAPALEELLLSALTLTDQGRLLGRLRKATPHFSEHVRVAACKALASVGSESALEALDEVSEGEGAVAEACSAAARGIRGEESEEAPA
jgi:HEAT repeat protein